MPNTDLRSSNQRLLRFVMLMLLLRAGTRAPSADFKGAAEVLHQAAQASPKPREKKADPEQAFRDKLKNFQERSTNLAPAEAAAQWLGLVDEFEKAPGESMNRLHGFRSFRPLEFEAVLQVLPPPPAWLELERAVDARSPSEKNQKRELGLRLIAHTLTRNVAKRAEDLKALDELAKKQSGPDAGYEFIAVFQMLNESILATMDDPDAILRMLESQLGTSSELSMSLTVPNLVALVGPVKSEEFLRKAMKSSRPLVIEPGTPTHKLATRVALEMIDQMPKPQWSLINSLDSVELFEAMDKKFNQPKKETAQPAAGTGFFGVDLLPGEPHREDTQARLYYFLGLIAADRVNDAIKVAKDFGRNSAVYFPPDVIKQMERAGLTRQLNSFFATLLKNNPEAPFWGEYVRVAAHAGQGDEALKLVRATSENKDLTPARRSELKGLLPMALLANDDVEAGIAELRQALTNRHPAPAGIFYSSEMSVLSQPALLIARIGILLDRKEWISEGIAAAKSQLEDAADAETGRWDSPETELSALLSELGRGVEAEELLLNSLRNAVTKGRPGPRGGDYYGGNAPAARVLAALLKVYYEAGRFEDVVALLDQAEYWGVGDLAELERNVTFYAAYNMSTHHSIETPLAFYAASALSKVGRKKEAGEILDPLLEQRPGLDRLYELLLDLNPTNPVPRLDALYARDQFEERPLIWKAHWLRTQNKLEEAEAAARKAISIDPSDGEEGPGDRLRAYAELAEIRAARGDSKEADFLRGAVAAIRESEMADRLVAAGLLRRAVRMYQDSLTHFADAYCIQSRLAIQLADLGLHEQAEEHYRRAYELMPESFGRVESHCFGCERAFEGERAQGIAEKIFTQLAQKTPNKPQVHYLLGYIREEQERPKEALDHYRTAVKLDPDYLNAWHKIAQISAKTVVPADERDNVVFNLLRLSPNRRHGGYRFDTVTDLAGLWARVANTPAATGRTGTGAKLYPLAASKRKLEQQAVERATEDLDIPETMFFSEEREMRATPAAAVTQNGFIQAGALLFQKSRALVE